MKSGVTKLVDKTPQVLAGIAFLRKNHVYVGVPASTAGRGGGAINNAALLYIHTNGAPEVGIPARDAIHPTINENKEKFAAQCKKAGALALDGKFPAVQQTYAAMGQLTVNEIKGRITAGLQPPLGDATLRTRARRAGKGTGISIAKGATRELAARARGAAPSVQYAKPLIDTGALLAAITYVVGPKSKATG